MLLPPLDWCVLELCSPAQRWKAAAILAVYVAFAVAEAGLHALHVHHWTWAFLYLSILYPPALPHPPATTGIMLDASGMPAGGSSPRSVAGPCNGHSQLTGPAADGGNASSMVATEELAVPAPAAAPAAAAEAVPVAAAIESVSVIAAEGPVPTAHELGRPAPHTRCQLGSGNSCCRRCYCSQRVMTLWSYLSAVIDFGIVVQGQVAYGSQFFFISPLGCRPQNKPVLRTASRIPA